MLRALAIVLVLMAHAQWPGMAAGFVGVDVFFVLSGYLVVGGAQQALRQGDFSVSSFLLARAWRLFPAAAVVLLLVLLLFQQAFLPQQLQSLGKQTAISVAGLQNISLWQAGSDYFSASVQEHPLMHLWSLAVEGQFYLALALLVVCCACWNWSLQRWVIWLFVLSLGVWAWGWLTYPVATYYWLPTRGWEFMVGALLAMHRSRLIGVPQWLVLALLAFMVWLGSQPVPSKPLLQISAVLLTAFLLISSENFVWQRIGKSPVVQWLGNHAYVLYLVHWPVWVWVTHSGWWSSQQWPEWAWLPVSLFFSAFLHRVVEAPGIRVGQFWRKQPLRQRLACLAVLAALWVSIGVAGLAVWYWKGLPERLPESVRAAEASANDYGTLLDRCMMAKTEEWQRPFQNCQLGKGELSTIIWGDSHAAAFITGWPAQGSRVMLLSAGGCPAWIDVPWKEAELCHGLNQQWLQAVLRSPAKHVMLVGRWSTYWHANGYGFVDGLQEFKLISSDGSRLTSTLMQPLLAQGLRETIKALLAAGKQVTLVGPVPELTWAAPECHARRAWNNPTLQCDEPRQQAMARLLPVEHALQGLVREFPADRARYLSAWPAFCDATVCRSSGPEGIYYYDDDHLSATGARHLLNELGLGSRSSAQGSVIP